MSKWYVKCDGCRFELGSYECTRCKIIDGVPCNFMPADLNLSDDILKRNCDNCGYNDETCDACSSCDEDTASNWIQKDHTDRPEQRPAATPEPMSKPGQKEVFPELFKDITARREVGIKKYGYPLQTFNSRNAMNDAYQEVLDLAVYFKQAIMEREDDLHAGTHFQLEEKIIQWAENRGLYDGCTWESQFKKLREEIREWKYEVWSGDRSAEMIELGDMFVVLTNLAKKRGFSLLECGWAAYNKIKNRTGKMENGMFVKDAP